MNVRTLIATVAVTGVVALGCTDPVSRPGPQGPAVLEVSVAVFGTVPDLDGYVLELGLEGNVDPASRSVEASGETFVFPDLAPGRYAVRLASIAAHCAVDGANPRPATVAAGEADRIELDVLCPAADVIDVFERVSPKKYTDGLSERYFLREDGTFALDFGHQTTTTAEYLGSFSREASNLDLDFDGANSAGEWRATGVLDGDCLAVDYNLVMNLADFEDGAYCR